MIKFFLLGFLSAIAICIGLGFLLWRWLEKNPPTNLM